MITRIPDPVFKADMVRNFDTDGDGEISAAEAACMLNYGPIRTRQFGRVQFKCGHCGDMLVCQIYNLSQRIANRYYTEEWFGDWQNALE